jgi:hypothetical protein
MVVAEQLLACSKGTCRAPVQGEQSAAALLHHSMHHSMPCGMYQWLLAAMPARAKQPGTAQGEGLLCSAQNALL